MNMLLTTSSQRRTQSPSANAGFTLLEVILSLAILAGSLAALGEVMRMADQAARLTEDETQRKILAASIMDELVCGARRSDGRHSIAARSSADPPWVYSISIETRNTNKW